MIAASAIFISRKILGFNQSWNEESTRITLYKQEEILDCCVDLTEACGKQVSKQTSSALHDKNANNKLYKLLSSTFRKINECPPLTGSFRDYEL
jgi:hypothetical protein